MDSLEKYKTVWSNQPEEPNKLSTIEIYKMAHSKSSSIVKWIFIIGIIEFFFWTAINLIIPDSFYTVYEDLSLTNFLNIVMVLHYIIILFFLFIFYKNYKKVSTIDNTKKLISNILNVRKTVKYYVLYNLGTVLLIHIVFSTVLFSDSEKFMHVINPQNIAMDINQIITITIFSQFLVLILSLTLLWLFYKLVYGILLKKLHKNYTELIKLEDF